MFRARWRDLSRSLLFDEDEAPVPDEPEEDLENAEGAAIEIPEDFSALTDEELNELRAELREGFAATREATPVDVALLERYAEAARAVAGELSARAEAQLEAESRVEELVAEMETIAPEDTTEGPEEEEGEGEEDGEEEEAESEEAEEEAPAEPAEAEEERRVPVAASSSGSTTRITVPPSETARTLPRRARPLPTPERQRYMTASAGNEAGNYIDRSDVPGLIREVTRGHDVGRFARYAEAGEQHAERHPILRIEKQFPEELVIGANSDVLAVLDTAADPSRIPGGSLTAAGWCAPSETIYDLCALETAEGILSVPEVTVTRGGINHTMGPDFGDLYTDTGWMFSNAEVDYATKTCFSVVCPTFEETGWNIAGVCIQADLLMRQAFPEIIDRYVNGSLVAHQHRLAAARIAAIEAASTAETLLVPAGADGAAAPLLGAVELAAEKIRYRNRMSRGAVLEVVLPAWAEALVRADIAYRNGKDSLSVSDAEIASWFADRKVAPQFVYNFQDLDDTPGTAYPATIDFLIYPAGTWVGASDEIIRLDVVYDSTLLATNEYTALFSEEQWLLAQRCHDSRVITTNVCADGAIGAEAVACT